MFAAQADSLSGFVLGELARCGDMAAGKGSNGLAGHALLDVPISRTLHIKLAALKVWLPVCSCDAAQMCTNCVGMLPARMLTPMCSAIPPP